MTHIIRSRARENGNSLNNFKYNTDCVNGCGTGWSQLGHIRLDFVRLRDGSWLENGSIVRIENMSPLINGSNTERGYQLYHDGDRMIPHDNAEFNVLMPISTIKVSLFDSTYSPLDISCEWEIHFSQIAPEPIPQSWPIFLCQRLSHIILIIGYGVLIGNIYLTNSTKTVTDIL